MSNTNESILRIKTEIAALEQEVKLLREERKDAIQGNMGFSFGYDPAVAHLDQQISIAQSRINSKRELIDQSQQHHVAKQPVSAIQATFASDITPSQRNVLEALNILGQQLKVDERIWNLRPENYSGPLCQDSGLAFFKV